MSSSTSTPPPAAPPGLPAPYSLPPLPPARSPWRRLAPVIAIAVVVIVVLAVFFVVVSPSSSSGGSATSFAGAQSAGQSAANGVSGGPWTLVLAAGIASQGGLSENASSYDTANCSVGPVGAGPIPSPIHISPYSDFSSGTTPWWGLVYVSQASGDALIVAVVNGNAQPLALVSGSCVSSFTGLASVPTTVASSPSVAATIWQNGGSTFVSDHSSLSLTFVLVLIGGGSLSDLTDASSSYGATWIGLVTPCAGANPPSGTQPEFLALVNATSGDLELTYPTSGSCSNTTLDAASTLFPSGILGPSGSASVSPFASARSQGALERPTL